MITASEIEARECLADLCEIVATGNPVLVSRGRRKNVVLVSEYDYRRMRKIYDDPEIVAKIHEGIDAMRNGRIIDLTDEEMNKLGISRV